MTKKMFSIVSILIIAAMVLASCAPAATPTEAPKQEAAKPTEAPKVEAPTEAPKAAAGGAVKELKIIWAEWDPSNYLQQLVNDYEKEAGVKVTVVQEPWGSFADRVFTEFAGKGGSYDLVIGDSQWLGQGATQGHFVELTDIFDTELNGKALSQPTVQYYAEYPAGSKKYWAYPTEGDAIGWSYRKDLFEDPKEMEGFKAKYGYDLAVPQDLNQLRDIAEWFNRPDKNQYGIAVYTQKDYDGLAMGIEEVLWNFGGDWGNYATGQVKGIVNSEDSIKAVDFYKGLYQFAPPGSSNDFYAESLNHFTSGEVAMAMNYFAFFPGLVNEKTNKFAKTTGFFSNPKGPKGDFTSLGGQGMSIVSYISPERQAAAKDFLKWFAKTETQQKWADLGGYTCNADILKSEKFLANTPYNKAFSESMLKVKDFWNIPVYVELLNVAKVALHKFVVGGEGTAKEAMDAIAEGQDPILKDGGYQKEGAAPAAEAKPAEVAGVKIGLSFSDFATERWKNEATLMEKLLKDKGYEVMIQEANHDVKLQNDQIDNMVAQGAKALIVIAEDGDAASTAVDKAAQAGVKVIAYDRLIKTASVSAYISFDNVEVGRQQAAGVLKALDIDNRKDPVKMVKLGGSPTDNNAILFRKGQDEVLQKYVDSKKIEVVADQWVDNWDPANALKLMENVLTAAGNKVDAVVASNDGTALGALQAMKAQKLAGVVPISGQDATADGCNSIVKGELTVTIFKDIRKLSPLATDLVDKLLKGETVSELKKFTMAELTNDPAKTGDVNALFLPVVQVTKDNVFDEIVKSGFQTYDDVYRDIPEGSRPPKPEAGAAAPAEKPAAGAVEPGVGGKVVMMPKSSGNAYFETGTRVGGEEAIKALGYELVYTASEKSEASQQIQIIDAAAAQKPKAIVISATDPKAICPPLKKAMAAGIKVVTYDADAAECRDAFALQANAEGIGRGQIQIICDLLGGAGTCEGEIAILSATATAPNQNEWIKWMNEELKDAKYGKLKLVATVYGDDLDQKSYDEALGLFKSYPNLKGIISPTSVGVVAAARAITDKGLIGKIMLTGLGVPSQLKEFVKSGACPKFALWNPIDLGYLAIFTADALLKGKGKEGDKFTAGRLGEYTFGKDGVVLLGPPFIFDKDNVDNFGF